MNAKRDAIKRAIEILEIAGEHCESYAGDATAFYDEADCDGYCINDDCKAAANDLRKLLKDMPA